MTATIKKPPRSPHYTRRLLRFALVALLVELAAVFYVILPTLYATGIAHPRRAEVCCRTPAGHGLAYEEVAFNTADGLTLRGWYIPSQNRAVILLLHPFSGNRLSMLDQAAMLARHGYGALLFDLRAHGESDGQAISFRGEDALAALAYLQARPDVDPSRIGALGASLGGFVAIQAAAESEALRAVVADGPGIVNLADDPRPASLARFLDLPIQWVTFHLWDLQGLTPSQPVIRTLPNLAPRPVFFISGAKSSLEAAVVRRYYASSGEPRLLWEAPDAGHIQAWALHPAEYEQRVVAFFDQALTPLP